MNLYSNVRHFSFYDLYVTWFLLSLSHVVNVPLYHGAVSGTATWEYFKFLLL